MIFSGPFEPKCIAEACVASEKVGEGGPAMFRLLDPKVRALSERGRLGAMFGRGKGMRRGLAGCNLSALCSNYSCHLHSIFVSLSISADCALTVLYIQSSQVSSTMSPSQIYILFRPIITSIGRAFEALFRPVRRYRLTGGVVNFGLMLLVIDR